jgi:hypothetical protein
MPNDTNKPNIILDLDQTMISAEKPEDINSSKYKEKHQLFNSEEMEGYYTIYSRPKLQKFLDFIFEHFNVTIWTAASKDYALFIIDKIILKNPNRKLDFIFFSYHCKWSKKQKKNSKNLCMLWDVHKIPGYTENNTVILDDFKEDVHKCQPNNCIIASPFEFKDKGSDSDDFLEKLIPQLEKMIERIKSGDKDLANSVNIAMKTM